jgi:hypothetical protein
MRRSHTVVDEDMRTVWVLWSLWCRMQEDLPVFGEDGD